MFDILFLVVGSSKFNLDGVARGIPCSVGIGVLTDDKGERSEVFPGPISIKGSNEAELWVTGEALLIFLNYHSGRLIMKSDFFNGIVMLSYSTPCPWRLHSLVRYPCPL